MTHEAIDKEAPGLVKSAELQTIDEALVERVRRRIVEAFNPKAIYLFGSAARGESRYGSDLDLLVVMELPKGTTSLEMSRRIRSLFHGWRLPLDIIVLEPSAFAKRQSIPGDIVRIAMREGRRLHA